MLQKLQEYVSHIDEHTKHVLDFTSIGVVFGTLVQILPSVAAMASLVWSCIRIYETKTVQGWLKRGKK